MRKLILLVFIAITVSLSAYAQGTIPKNISPELKGKGLDSIPQNLENSDTIDFGKFYFSPPINLQLEMPDSLNANHRLHNRISLYLNQDQIYRVPNSEPVYSLRIVKPTGNYHLKIYEPDPSKNYTLLVKKY